MFRSALLFICVTFAIAWGLPALYAAFVAAPEQVGRGLTAVLLAAAFGPVIGGLVAARAAGREAWRRHLGFLTRYRVGWRWYLVPVAVVVATYGAVAAAVLVAGRAVHFDLWTPLALLILLPPPFGDTGPLEEPGFRGWLLPLLQERIAPWMAAIAVGVVWFLFHYAVLFPGFPFAAFDLTSFDRAAPFFIQIMSLSFIATVLFNATGGSVPVVFCAHWLANIAIRLSVYLETSAWHWPVAFAVIAVVVCVAGRRYLSADFTGPAREALGQAPRSSM